MQNKINSLLSVVGTGRITPAAYDTAWLVRLKKEMPDLSAEALQWVRANQLSDGSWGSSSFFYYHDRLVCTLSATCALIKVGNTADKMRISRALAFLEKQLSSINLSLSGATVGFEMIVPTLLDELVNYLPTNANPKGRASLHEAKQRKISKVPSQMISRHVTMAHSAEMAGTDNRRIINREDITERNGSIGYSPAATCYYVSCVNAQASQEKSHLRDIFLESSLPTVSTINLFETAWSLWNLQIAGASIDEQVACKHLDFIESSWIPGRGAAFAQGYTPKDGDDSSMAYEVLVRGGRNPDLDAILSYEDKDVFRCYSHENDPSISTNIHVIGALRQAGIGSNHPSLQKALNYLRKKQHVDGYWLGKWHTSPYYPTSHFVIAAAGYCCDDMVKATVQWFIDTQNADGSWGFVIATAEESAYSLQTLSHCRRLGYPIDKSVIQQGKRWLEDHQEETDVPLWIGKCLYSPSRVVESTVISALVMADSC